MELSYELSEVRGDRYIPHLPTSISGMHEDQDTERTDAEHSTANDLPRACSSTWPSSHSEAERKAPEAQISSQGSSIAFSKDWACFELRCCSCDQLSLSLKIDGESFAVTHFDSSSR